MGHTKAECQNPRVEREFTGECNFCGQPGHRRVDCPNKPAETCKICKQEGMSFISLPRFPVSLVEYSRRQAAGNGPRAQLTDTSGHVAANCTANRMFAEFQNLGIQDMSAEAAWKMLQEADKDKDVIDIKKVSRALPEYIKLDCLY